MFLNKMKLTRDFVFDYTIIHIKIDLLNELLSYMYSQITIDLSRSL